MDNGSDMLLWFVSVFLLAEIGVEYLLACLLFTRKTFKFEPTRLTIKSETLGYKRHKVIPKESIKLVVQVKDGGSDEDSFPSWGLRVEAEGKTILLFRQPYDKAAWFGSVVAEWSGALIKRVSPPANLIRTR